MGLFSGKKTITVSSTLYNLAGPEKDRPNYLKSTLFNSVMADAPSISDSIRESYFNGPGLQQRHFFNYAKRKDLRGFPTASVVGATYVDADVVAAQVPAAVGVETVVQRAEVSIGEPAPFIARWIAQNHPEELALGWVGDYEPNTKEFSVQLEGGGFHTFTDSTFDANKTHITAEYVQFLPDSTDAQVNEGTVEHTGSLPTDVTDAPVIQDNVTTTQEHGFDVRSGTEVREITRFEEVVGPEMYGIISTYNVEYTDYVDTTGTPFLVQRTNVETLTANTVKNQTVAGTQIFIYEVGSGTASLDALVNNSSYQDDKEFYPLLPLRIDNHSITHPGYTDAFYDETKAAYRRATSESIDDILDEIEDNDDIDDIDYAYIMWGCALNSKEQSAIQYIYKFFDEMRQYQSSNSSTISDFEAEVSNYNSEVAAYKSWLTTVGAYTRDSDWANAPPKPTQPRLDMPASTTIRLTTNKIRNASDPDENGFDFRTSWVHIDTYTTSSNFQIYDEKQNLVDAVDGQVAIEKGTPLTWTYAKGIDSKSVAVALAQAEDVPEQMDVILLKQRVGNSTVVLRVYGLKNQNYVYGGKSVDITSFEAMDDDDVSGFIIPLHYPTLRQMSIVDYTQIATANTHIIFNSYEVVKQKWYENFFVILIVMVVIIAVAAFLAPGLFAGAGGVLGGNAALGASLGFSGTAAIVAGAVANYLASIVISQIISFVSVAVFGEKWGSVIAPIAMLAVGGGFSGGFSLGNIVKIGNALANGYAGYVQGEIAEDLEDFQDETKEYEKQMDYIQSLIDGLGGNDLNFDPLSLTDTTYGNDAEGGPNGYLPETADEFIRRTTMTMDEIIEISYGMVTDFVDVNLILPKN